jgi:NAD(P)-dependent dehydrogenase (short-subunit alcohol dehydrogenase family)
MNGKVVLVTGANGGLGNAVTQGLLDAGATVVGTSRRIAPKEFMSPNFTGISGEISSLASAKAIADQLLGKHGRLDALVHLVGGFAGGKSVAETDDETLQRMFDMNFNCVFHVLRATLPALRASGAGRIVAIGSRAAVDPGPGVGAYSASKAAMVSLIRTVAAENKDAGVTANAILPGTMDTPANRAAMPQADFSKWVRTENVASLVVWLAGAGGKDVSGAVIPIYGAEG